MGAWSKGLGLRWPWTVEPDAELSWACGTDDEAISKLYAEHHEALRGFCRRLTGDAPAAEDLVHDVFVALPRALRRYRGDCSMRTFLRAVAVNHARHHLRAAARRRAAMDRMARELEHQVPLAPLELERRELARELSAALDRLPSAQRVAFVLCEVEDMTAAEAAIVAGVPHATLRTRLFHARRKLRELMEGSSC